MKRVIVISFLAGASIALMATITMKRPMPRLVWNMSASAPIGLYWVKSAAVFRPGDLLVIRAPEQIARLMDERSYLPLGVMLLKRVSATSGTEICRHGATVFVAGKAIAKAKRFDARGRSLPQWQGCRRLGADEVFLINADVPDSLDGRYFGPFPKSSIVGLAYPIWIDEENDDRS